MPKAVEGVLGVLCPISGRDNAGYATPFTRDALRTH